MPSGWEPTSPDGDGDYTIQSGILTLPYWPFALSVVACPRRVLRSTSEKSAAAAADDTPAKASPFTKEQRHSRANARSASAKSATASMSIRHPLPARRRLRVSRGRTRGAAPHFSGGRFSGAAQTGPSDCGGSVDGWRESPGISYVGHTPCLRNASPRGGLRLSSRCASPRNTGAPSAPVVSKMAISPGPHSWRARSPCRRARGEFEADATASESRRLETESQQLHRGDNLADTAVHPDGRHLDTVT